MKLITALLFLIISSSFCLAQNKLLPVDEQGKFIYFELVEAKGVPIEVLKERVSSFLKQPYKDLKFKIINGDTAFVASGKFVINKTLLVMSHPSGEVLYHFQAEVKESKFRFWLSDFNFVPYQRDRYGNFVAGTNKGIPLENNPGKLNAAQWKEYQNQAARYAYQFAGDFKAYLAGKMPLVVSAKEKTVVRKEW